MISRFSKTKIRWIFGLFLAALIIPAAFLSHQAHRQLDWQIRQQYQQDAKALVALIDDRLAQMIAKEESRSDSDYSFFILTGDSQSRLVQRSQLSKLPFDTELDGVIGYFQIDQEGNFSSPILPTSHVQQTVQPQLYGISPEEKVKRQRLEHQIKTILLNNQLVSDTPTPVQTELEEQDKTLDDRRLFEPELQQKMAENQAARQYLEKQSMERQSKRRSSRLLAPKETQNKPASKQANLFDTARGIKKTKKQKPNISVTESANKSRRSRTETYYGSQDLESNFQTKPADILNPSSQVAAESSPRISLFSSELEPFKIALLESGHIIAYRQVWRSDKLFIQGAVIDGQGFIEENFGRLFYSSLLSQVSQMNIYFAKHPIQTLMPKTSERKMASSQFEEDIVLYQTHLSEPFNQLELVLHLTSLPENASAYFIQIVTALLFMVLVLGTFFLYRLTIKQSELAQQQQDFVSSVSHELKTPLTSIRMYGEILKQGWASEQKRQEYYDYIYTESERLARLIANVLQISKISHNALDLNMEWIAVAELRSLIQSKLQSQVEQSQFQLELSIDPSLEKCNLYLDSDAFVQIMINLVDNAIKYAAKAEKRLIEIRFEGPNKQGVQVSVRDYGPGIEESQLKSIFQLFYRSGSELTREVSGTGIGLALVNEFLTAMSGKIEAINQSQGVEFRMTFEQFEL